MTRHYLYEPFLHFTQASIYFRVLNPVFIWAQALYKSCFYSDKYGIKHSLTMDHIMDGFITKNVESNIYPSSCTCTVKMKWDAGWGTMAHQIVQEGAPRWSNAMVTLWHKKHQSIIIGSGNKSYYQLQVICSRVTAL